MKYIKHEDFQRDIEKLENIIKQSNNRMAELKGNHWALGEDTKEIENISISCNYSSWLGARGYKKGDPFYVKCLNSEDEIDFSLEGAKMIVEYLQEKIDFLES